MLSEHIALVRESYAKLQQVDGAVKLFYRRLFEFDPGLRTMFNPDLTSQHEKFATMVDRIINHLEDDDAVKGELRELGHRHRRYGVTDHHYLVVQVAIMETLEQCLGPAFTPQVRRAWVAWYTMVGEAMKP